MSEPNDNGNGAALRRVADNVVMVLAARTLSIVIVPVMVAFLIWVGNMLASGHDALIQIQQRIMDKDADYDRTLANHENRLETIEAAHRAGVP